ncbi:metal-dependent hydrolase [Candidatus Woesearchaeota archaeon]|nr:metal-dependent hydrolase [Candidatus Woesearchaeota archaeon]
MLARTHLAFALLIGLLTFSYFNLNPILFIIIMSLTSFLPDIDHPKSKIGRKIKILSYPINFVFGHRGFFHSIFVAFGLSFAIWYFFGNYYIPFFIGFVSHLIGDALTVQGVNFIYPFKELRVKGFITTGGVLENILFFVFILLIILILL